VLSDDNDLRGSDKPQKLRKKSKKGLRSSTKSRKRKATPTAVVTIMHNTNPSRSKSGKRKMKISNSSAALPYRVQRTSQPSQGVNRRGFATITEDKGEDDNSWF